MDTMRALAKGLRNRRNERRVFDWELAAKIIKARGAKNASAGLAEDWEWTGGEILLDGKPAPRMNPTFYLASIWATPVLEIDGERIVVIVTGLGKSSSKNSKTGAMLQTSGH